MRQQINRRDHSEIQATSRHAAAGKQTRTSGLSTSARAGDLTPSAASLADMAGPPASPMMVQALAAVENAFSLHLPRNDTHALAQAGVAGAGQPLPHLAAIQRSFGRHEAGGIGATVGGDAATAAQTMGATAYATGDRVAFAQEPDLHTAAHEAAHVVQQRAGVQLRGGVGVTGDRYEQHADRVADTVVAGQSAESILDEMADTGGAAAPAPAVQRHDSPTHVRAGDSVPGNPVTVHGIVFTPGELAALVDYVGSLENLEGRFTLEQVTMMKDLLVRGIEDVLPWEEATGGLYADEAQANEKHFAPAAGDGGQNFHGCFLTAFTQALTTAQGANGDAAGMQQARLSLYTAEHYMEDAFSSGHQLAAKDIETCVAQQMTTLESWMAADRIAKAVWARKQEEIQHYGFGVSPTLSVPLSLGDFMLLAELGALKKGVAGMTDAVRRFVHENLSTGVEVTSKAQPAPFMLSGDHSLPAAPESIKAMQAALTAMRAAVESAPGTTGKPAEDAATLFDVHCPTPTTTGKATVTKAIEDATASDETIIAAVVDTMCDTIEELMDTATGMVPMLHKRGDIANDPHEFPTIPPADPDPVLGQPASEPAQSYPQQQQPQ